MIHLGGGSCTEFSFESGIFMYQLKLIIMCLNETYCRVRVGKHLSDMFPITKVLIQEDA
jgi:hypothetical protein